MTSIAIVACAVLGMRAPDTLAGATCWSVFVIAVLWGLGVGATRALKVELGFGEQLLVGTTVWVLLGGWLLALGVASRLPLLCIAIVGAAIAILELVRRPRWPAWSSRSTPYAVLAGLLAIYLIVHLLGMVATRGNPYDDHVAYTAFVKRVLDCGNLLEPFSLRRLSAYGGQTILLALVALRGDVKSVDVLDRGVFFAIALLILIDIARQRRLHPGITCVIVVFVLALTDLTNNSAASWTGVACFLGAYGFASNDSLSPRQSLVLTFAACGVACTLRQNYLLPAALFAALLLVSHARSIARTASWRAVWGTERTTVTLAIAAAGVIVIPYAFATWRSSATFLYPMLPGTANTAAPVQATGLMKLDELALYFNVLFHPEPIRIWWVLVPFMILARDTRPIRPWPAFLLASCIGFGYLIHSFSGADSPSLWRYGFGYLIPLVIVFLIDIGDGVVFARDAVSSRLQLSSIAVFVVFLAVMAQIIQGEPFIAKRITWALGNLTAGAELGSNKPADSALYRDLQASMPAGARVAIALDDPYLLDFSRNDIVNLDLIGFAAPAPGIPSFLGPERWRAYFLEQGIRYVAYVRTDYSTYQYRRDDWILRVFFDTEFWRFMGSHVIDMLDTFKELSNTSRIVFDRDGLRVIDLGDHPILADSSNDAPELVRQDQFVRRLSETEIGEKAWQLSSRGDVVFDIDGGGPSPVNFEWPRLPVESNPAVVALFGPPVHEPAFRWLNDRTRVRVRGSGVHRLHMKIHSDVLRLRAIPSMILTLDGVTLYRGQPDASGDITIDVDATCRGWCNLYLISSTLTEPWLDALSMRAIKLLEFDWEPK